MNPRLRAGFVWPSSLTRSTAFVRRDKRNSGPGTRAAAAVRNDSTLISTPPTTFAPTHEGYVGFKHGCHGQPISNLTKERSRC